jgi:hypothetical protein
VLVLAECLCSQSAAARLSPFFGGFSEGLARWRVDADFLFETLVQTVLSHF